MLTLSYVLMEYCHTDSLSMQQHVNLFTSYNCMMSECCIFFSTFFNSLLIAKVQAQQMV
jgi:hypothetical protein